MIIKRHPRTPGVAAAYYVSASSSLSLAYPFQKLCTVPTTVAVATSEVNCYVAQLRALPRFAETTSQGYVAQRNDIWLARTSKGLALARMVIKRSYSGCLSKRYDCPTESTIPLPHNQSK